MARQKMHRRKYFARKRRPVLRERFHQPTPRSGITPKRVFRMRKVTLKQHRCPVIERMRQRRWRMNPFQPVLAKRNRRKKWRTGSKRMNRRAKIMPKARQSHLQRSSRTTSHRFRFENIDSQSRPCENNRASKPVRPGAYNSRSVTSGRSCYGSAHHRALIPASPSPTATPPPLVSHSLDAPASAHKAQAAAASTKSPALASPFAWKTSIARSQREQRAVAPAETDST